MTNVDNTTHTLFAVLTAAKDIADLSRAAWCAEPLAGLIASIRGIPAFIAGISTHGGSADGMLFDVAHALYCVEYPPIAPAVFRAALEGSCIQVIAGPA